MARSYERENARSRPITSAKRVSAGVVVPSVMRREVPVSSCYHFAYFSSFLSNLLHAYAAALMNQPKKQDSTGCVVPNDSSIRSTQLLTTQAFT